MKHWISDYINYAILTLPAKSEDLKHCIHGIKVSFSSFLHFFVIFDVYCFLSNLQYKMILVFNNKERIKKKLL